MKTKILALMALAVLGAINLQLSILHAQSTAFAYQGQLNSGGAPANGSYDLSFSLYSASSSGTLVAGPVTNTAVAVTNGLFTTSIDFGNVFNGSSYWLEVSVSTNGADQFTALTPRQPITPVPYSLYSTAAGTAATATSAGTATSVPAAGLTGTLAYTQLPATIVTNGGTVTLSGTFIGNGAGLSNVVVNTTNLTGKITDLQLATTNLVLLNGTNVLVGTNRFTGIVIATNANNQITGIFTGNASGLTNLNGAQITGVIPIAQLPTSIVTNGGTVTLSGTFIGNGAGLSNVVVNTTNLVGTISDAQLATTNVALLNGTNRLTGTNNFSGVVIATNSNNQITGTFSGNASGLTNLNGTQITGIIPIAQLPNTIITNGGTATLSGTFIGNGAGLSNVVVNTTNLVGTISDAQLATTNIALLNGTNRLTGTNNFSGVVIATNSNNQITGTFSGNASGLTNLNGAQITGIIPIAQLPTTIITNGGTVTLSGTFVGNGAGLSNVVVNTTNLVGTISDAQLATTNVALLNGTNRLTGTNNFSGIVIATNVNNQITGTFSGNASGLTNLNGAQITGIIPIAQLPTTIITNGGTATLSGTFIGNGAGLSNVVVNTTNLVGTISDAQLTTTNIALLNGTNNLTGTNNFAGVVIATNVNNQITGTFAGNASGLTNLNGTQITGVIPIAQLPTTIITNGGTVTLSGTFIGNGAGLSNVVVNTTNLVGTISDAQLTTTNIALLNGTNNLTGTNNFAGVVIATNVNNQITGTFAGNASGLTNLNGAQITGIIPIAQLPTTIITNGGTATLSGTFIGNGAGLSNVIVNTTNLVGTISDAQLATTNIALLNGTNNFTGTNNFAGVVIATNVNNQITGTFSGNASGLTNLNGTQITGVIPIAQLPATIITNGASVTLSGTFVGDGSGLSNVVVNTTNLVGTISDAQLATTNVALLNGTNNLTGTNNFAGVVIATNVNNQITGTFAGNASGLTNLNGAQITGVIPIAQLPATIITNGASVTLSGTFVGDGSGLSNVVVNTTNLVGTISDAQLATTNVALLNGTNSLTGTNNFSGVVIATNINNQITGTFAGNASGLTNLNGAQITGVIPIAQLPATIITNGASVTLSGTFVGDGSSLSNVVVNTTNLVGTISDAQLATTNVALLNGTNNLTGTNNFAGVVIATNVNNQITGTFAGNASGLTNLNGAQITGIIPIAQLPTTIITNGANVTLSGTFTGDGSALSNVVVNTTNLVGTISDAQLATTNVALLNGTNSLTGTNNFSGVVIATNVNNQIAGTFSGNASGLTNVNSGNVTTPLYTWLGPTNAFGVTNNAYWVYDATGNVSVTNIVGAVSGQVNFGTLEISNAAAFAITSTFTGFGLAHGLITSNPVVIPAGQEAIWEFWTVGTVKTNYMNTP